jgi:hypothetical protein
MLFSHSDFERHGWSLISLNFWFPSTNSLLFFSLPRSTCNLNLVEY